MEGVLAALAMFFTVGALGFDLALFVAFGLIWVLISSRRGFGALLTFAVTVAFVQFIARYNLLQFVRDNALTVAVWAVGYVAVGVAHLFARWHIHVKNKASEWDELKSRFCTEKGYSAELTRPQKYEFQKFVASSSYNPNLDEKEYHRYDPATEGCVPSWDGSKYTIGRWTGWWPWCLLGLLDDYVTFVFRIIRENLRGVLNYMARRAFGNRVNDMLDPRDREAAQREFRDLEDQRRQEEDAREQKQERDRRDQERQKQEEGYRKEQERLRQRGRSPDGEHRISNPDHV